MHVATSDLWFCVDCLFAAVNGDYPEDPDRSAAVEAGLGKLGQHVVPDYDVETGDGHREFSWCGCDCCGSRLGGEYHRFAILTPGPASAGGAT